jgi:hypothetical protein
MVILACAGSPLAHRWLTDSISVGFLKLRAVVEEVRSIGRLSVSNFCLVCALTR